VGTSDYMNLQIAELRDAVTGTFGYLWRILGDGLSATPKRAIVFTLPGVFVRPHKADDATVGTEECVVLVIGDERIVLATRNAKAEADLDEYIGRDRDPGETLLSATDGTNRCIVDVRPNGDVVIKGESSSKSVAITWEASSGDLNVAAEGDINLTPGSSGTVKIGGTSVDDFLMKHAAFKTEYDAHVHTNPPPLGNTGVPTVPLTTACRSTKGEVK
jgi:hypothetical protein